MVDLKGRSKTAKDKFVISSELESTIEQDTLSSIINLVERSFAARRSFLVSELALALKELAAVNTSSNQDSDWIEIDSLSSLRRIVGGRFQNIKSMWLNCGFPMGNTVNRNLVNITTADSTFDMQAWVVLSSWILKSGFEVRLAPHSSEGLFEIRKTKTK